MTSLRKKTYSIYWPIDQIDFCPERDELRVTEYEGQVIMKKSQSGIDSSIHMYSTDFKEININLWMNTHDFQVFKTWVKETLEDGTLDFYAPNPVDLSSGNPTGKWVKMKMMGSPPYSAFNNFRNSWVVGFKAIGKVLNT